MKIERILVATDLSPDSEACWESVFALARACSAEVFLMRAIPEPEFTLGFDHVARPALCEFEALRESGLERGVNVSEEFCIVSGRPGEAILRVAQERRVGLIVLGAHPGMGFTGEEVLGGSNVPVWFVRPCQAAAPRSILCATDDGAAGLRALERSIWLARSLNARLCILRVDEGEEVSDDRLAQIAEETRRHVAAFSSEVPVEVYAKAGRLEACLIEGLRESGADLLILGSADRRGIDRLRAPNRSEWALRRAPASLLVSKGAPWPAA